VQTAINRAMNCLVRNVERDERYRPDMTGPDVLDLLVQTVPSCDTENRRLIELYDKVYGDGGEEFFIGPFVDGIAHEVQNRHRARAGP
jgi:hypothetical protein